MTVKEWGKGRPDYYVPTISSRPQTITQTGIQANWYLNKTYTVAGQATSIDTNFYTVTANKKLSLGMVDVSTRESCINKLRLYVGATLIAEFRFDMRGNLIFTSLSGQTLTAGQTIVAYIYNNDPVTAEFTLTISGIVEREE